MATITEPKADWTARDVLARFGPIPIRRICTDPAPGTAREGDVIAFQEREGRLFELVDGVLVEKTVGSKESLLACLISTFLNNFVLPRKLGYVLGADGMIRLNPDMIRIPDVCFLARGQFSDGKFPEDNVCPVVPLLAVEVLSESNTRKEMADKLADYFEAGVRLVWYVDRRKMTVRVFTGPDRSRLLRSNQTLDGGDVLPGFELALRDLFDDPGAEGAGPN